MLTRLFGGWKGIAIALLLALLIGGLGADFGALASGQSKEILNIIFTPHKGKDAGPPESPLGFIEIVAEDTIYKSRIAGGAMDIIFEDGKVTIPQKKFLYQRRASNRSWDLNRKSGRNAHKRCHRHL